MQDNSFDVLEVDEPVRRLVSETEITGRRTFFARNGKVAAILLSYDEYVALKETLAIATDRSIRARLEHAEDELRRNALLQVEDLFVE